jgi:hypothetical protein
MADLKLEHAREFTDIENLTLDLWLTLEDAGLDERARSLLDAGLMFEHYTSLLASDPAQRSQAEVVQQARLGFKLSDEVRLANEELRAWRQRHEEKVERRVRLLRGTVESLAPVPDQP